MAKPASRQHAGTMPATGKSQPPSSKPQRPAAKATLQATTGKPASPQRAATAATSSAGDDTHWQEF